MRLLGSVSLVAGLVTFLTLTWCNRRLHQDIAKLEGELGQMTIDETDKLHLVAIEAPTVPPEVAAYVDRVWQFRCYVPPGYDFRRMFGGGRVSDAGLFFQGDLGWYHSLPSADPFQQLLTISLRQDAEDVVCFISFGGASTSTTWPGLAKSDLDDDAWIFEALAIPGGPARSFDPDKILPILKAYDQSDAEVAEIEGQSVTTYPGGLVVLCPTERKVAFDQLREGKEPEGYKQSWIANGKRQ